jgi:hypothetical protein
VRNSVQKKIYQSVEHLPNHVVLLDLPGGGNGHKTLLVHKPSDASKNSNVGSQPDELEPGANGKDDLTFILKTLN